MRLLCLAALLCTPAIATAASLAGPLAPAASGELQCLAPNTLTKTCQSITTYRVSPKGGIENTARVLVSQSPVVIMTTVTRTTIRNDQVCGVMRAEDIGDAAFSVDGKPATDEQANTFRAVLQAAMATSFGQDVCTGFVPGVNGLNTHITMNGTEQPGSQRILWVTPSDGYKVAP